MHECLRHPLCSSTARCLLRPMVEVFLCLGGMNGELRLVVLMRRKGSWRWSNRRFVSDTHRSASRMRGHLQHVVLLHTSSEAKQFRNSGEELAEICGWSPIASKSCLRLVDAVFCSDISAASLPKESFVRSTLKSEPSSPAPSSSSSQSPSATITAATATLMDYVSYVTVKSEPSSSGPLSSSAPSPSPAATITIATATRMKYVTYVKVKSKPSSPAPLSSSAPSSSAAATITIATATRTKYVSYVKVKSEPSSPGPLSSSAPSSSARLAAEAAATSMRMNCVSYVTRCMIILSLLVAMKSVYDYQHRRSEQSRQ